MKDPFEYLGVPPTADETAIRRRYLELVRQFPPDRDPERFAEIREAYDLARDPDRRLTKLLFSLETGDSIDQLIEDLHAKLRQAPMTLKSLLSLAESS